MARKKKLKSDDVLKYSISVAILIAGCAIAYYFLFFLPQKTEKDQVLDTIKLQEPYIFNDQGEKITKSQAIKYCAQSSSNILSNIDSNGISTEELEWGREFLMKDCMEKSGFEY